MNDGKPQFETLPVRRIVSGGQTGVDRGALDAAIEIGLPHGGWCPRGRLAEDGTLPPRYALRETASARYHHRTRRNVLDSDGTLILHRGPLSGGTDLTRQFAERHEKPLLLVDLQQNPQVESVRRWLIKHAVAVLNIAGPRESTAPGIAEQTRRFVVLLFAPGDSPGECL
ncbi:MAG: putative molybdenum carrier protein [Pirellulaceae bacterium]